HAEQQAKPGEEETPEDDPDAPFERYKKAVLTTEVGINRVAWDLRYKGAEKIKGAKVDAGNVEAGPLVNPGLYSFHLKVGSKTVKGVVVVHADPRLHLSAADMDEQLHAALSIRDDVSRVARMVSQIRSVRKQLVDREELLKGNSKASGLHKPAREIIHK